MKTAAIAAFLTGLAAQSPEEQIAALTGALNDTAGEVDAATAEVEKSANDLAALQEKYDELETESTAEVEKSANDLAALKDKYTELQTESTAEVEKSANDLAALKDKYTELETESTAEVERLSTELSFATSPKGKGALSVEVNGKRYVTAPGRKYNIGGKDVAVEDLVKDLPVCTDLISKGSGIFRLAE